MMVAPGARLGVTPDNHRVIICLFLSLIITATKGHRLWGGASDYTPGYCLRIPVLAQVHKLGQQSLTYLNR